MALVYSLYTSRGVPGYWKNQVSPGVIYFIVVERDSKHLGFNSSLISICRQGGMDFWHFLPLTCIWVQPLQLEGGVESCRAPVTRLDKGRLIVSCADMVITACSISLHSGWWWTEPQSKKSRCSICFPRAMVSMFGFCKWKITLSVCWGTTAGLGLNWILTINLLQQKPDRGY